MIYDQKKIKYNFPSILQNEKYDCGLICLKIIARYYDLDLDTDKYQSFINSEKKGISIYDIRKIAENESFSTGSYECNIDYLKKINNPIIVLLYGHHYVVLYKYKNGSFYISDPSKGLYTLTVDEFRNKLKDNNVSIVKIITIEKLDLINNDPKISSAIEFAFSHLWNHKKETKQIILLTLIISSIYGILPFISRSVIDIGINQNDINFIYLILIINLLLIIFRSFGEWLKTAINAYLASKIRISIISNYLVKLFKLPINDVERMPIGDIIERARDQEKVQNFISGSALSIFLSLIIVIIYSIILLLFNNVLFYIFIILTTLYIITSTLFFKFNRKMDMNKFDIIAEEQSIWIENIKNYEDIKLNNYSIERIKKWENIQHKIHTHSIKLMNMERFQGLISNSINSIKDISLTFYAATLVINGEISFGTLISVLFIIGQLNLPIREVIAFIRNSQNAFVSYSRAYQIHIAKNEQNPQDKVRFIDNSDNIISFRNVNFKYRDVGNNVLSNISFNIPINKKIAIVGKSGCGKTTLLKLIAKVYDNYTGEIRVGNRDIRLIENSFWRDSIGAIFQDSKLYKDTILNNIVMNDRDNFNIERVNNSINAVNLGVELSKMQKGIYSSLDDQGNNLSQGQKQRIILARAIYKNAKILLLDESTNSLDPQSEAATLNYLNNNTQTTVIVSHKLSTIRIADEILVMDRGFIVERGPFETLSNNRNSFFYKLFESQLGNG